MANYIKWIRERVGHDPIILNAAAAFIVNARGEILLLKRADRSEDVWGLPGGMMEIGESAEETMRREVLEETGLEVKVDTFLGAYTKKPLETYPNGDKAHVTLFIFVCTPVGGTLRADSTEALELRYFDPNRFPPGFRHPNELRDYREGRRGVIR